MYRPDGFDAEVIARENMPFYAWGTQEYTQVIRGINYGADAMLEALERIHEPCTLLSNGVLQGISGKTYHAVFIPDEVVEKNEH